jgi:hypothetical protein
MSLRNCFYSVKSRSKRGRDGSNDERLTLSETGVVTETAFPVVIDRGGKDDVLDEDVVTTEGESPTDSVFEPLFVPLEVLLESLLLLLLFLSSA